VPVCFPLRLFTPFLAWFWGFRLLKCIFVFIVKGEAVVQIVIYASYNKHLRYTSVTLGQCTKS